MELLEYNIVDALDALIDYRGRTPKKSEKGIPTLSAKSVKMGYIDYNQCYYISKEEYDSFMVRGFPQKGDILFTTEAPLGVVAKLDRDDVAVAQRLLTLRGKKGVLDNDFLLYYLQSSEGQQRIMAKQSGSTVMGIRQEEFRKINILIPSYEEQKKIASVLSALDDKIALNKKMNQKLEAMAKRLYDYWFVQYDFPDKNGHPYKTTGGPMTYSPTLKRQIPLGWDDGVLSDIANITMGQSPDGASYNEDGEGMIFYQGSTDFGMRFPTVRQYTTAPTRFAKKGDILMSVRAPVGAVNIANTDCCIGRGLSALNSKLGSLSHLYFLIDVFKKTFENKNTVGTTFGSITKDELYALPVVIPDKNVIAQFEKMAKPIFDRQMKLGEESNRLTKLRDKLLPLLMNGQVVVG